MSGSTHREWINMNEYYNFITFAQRLSHISVIFLLLELIFSIWFVCMLFISVHPFPAKTLNQMNPSLQSRPSCINDGFSLNIFQSAWSHHYLWVRMLKCLLGAYQEKV